MLLTEAVHMVSMMPREACRRTAYDNSADEMLRSVCRWRMTNRWQQLVTVTGNGFPVKMLGFQRADVRQRNREKLLSVLREPGEGYTTDELAVRLGTTRMAIQTALVRLSRPPRDNGIERRIIGPEKRVHYRIVTVEVGQRVPSRSGHAG